MPKITTTHATQSLDVELLDSTGRSLPLEAELVYRTSDPYAVTATFHTPGGTVTWTFGRDLLALGLSEPSGECDVKAWPSFEDNRPNTLMLELSSPDGDALLALPHDEVDSFLDAAYRLVPLDTEGAHLDIESALNLILGGANN